MRSLLISSSGRLAVWPTQRFLLWSNSAGLLVRWRRRRSSAVGTQFLRLGCGGYCHCQKSPPSFRWPLVQATFRNRGVESITPLPGRLYPLYATTRPRTRLQTREFETGKTHPPSDLFGALAVCDEPRTEVFQPVSILQCLTIKQDDLKLLTRDEC